MSSWARFILALFLITSTSITSASSFESADLISLKEPLDTAGKVSIQIPANATFKDSLSENSNITIYESSGEDTANAFRSAFEAKTESVVLIGNCSGDECYASADNNGSKYLLLLDLVHWEERSTNWSGKPDRLTVLASIYDLAAGSTISKSYIHVNTFLSKSPSGKVEGYLPDLANRYVSSIYSD